MDSLALLLLWIGVWILGCFMMADTRAVRLTFVRRTLAGQKRILLWCVHATELADSVVSRSISGAMSALWGLVMGSSPASASASASASAASQSSTGGLRAGSNGAAPSTSTSTSAPSIAHRPRGDTGAPSSLSVDSEVFDDVGLGTAAVPHGAVPHGDGNESDASAGGAPAGGAETALPVIRRRRAFRMTDD